MPLTKIRPDELVEFARALRPPLRDGQARAEEVGRHPEDLHQAFVDAGFYRILVPERFGGYGYGLDTFFRVGIEIARGDPGVGWNYVLGAGHAFQVVSWFPEATQEAVLGGGKLFIAPMRQAPPRPADRVEGGYRVSGTWDYCSGSTYSTYALVGLLVPTQDGSSKETKIALVPRSDYQILDDWGGDLTLGMRASGSNSIYLDDVFVPEAYVVDFVYREPDLQPGAAGTIGYRLHGDPLFLARTLSFFYAELVATQIGCALAAADEYEELMRAKTMSFPPRLPRTESPDYARWYGQIRSKALAAESILMDTMRLHREMGIQWRDEDRPITSVDDVELRARILEAAQLAISAVDLAFATSGTSSVAKGSRMQKYYRDAAMYRTHIAAQFEALAGTSGSHYVGNGLVF